MLYGLGLIRVVEMQIMSDRYQSRHEDTDTRSLSLGLVWSKSRLAKPLFTIS